MAHCPALEKPRQGSHAGPSTRSQRRVDVSSPELGRTISFRGGTYLPGSPLPPIGRLADEFEVSRDTVQRSIQMLSDERKVTRWPGLGWYIVGGAPHTKESPHD